jgi:hypothetical protein
VTFARDNALKTEAVVDMRKVWQDALRRNLGLTNPAAIAAELHPDRRVARLNPINRPQRQPQTTTARMVAMEKENIQTLVQSPQINLKLRRPRRAAPAVRAAAPDILLLSKLFQNYLTINSGFSKYDPQP